MHVLAHHLRLMPPTLAQLNDLGSLGLAAAYVADPAFVGLGAQSQISTINDDLRRE